ncbi:HNH homing endonuclease [Escherichia phage HC13]|uniref:HNH homing endonuclease n=1 Tax=Escherichia phage HC13 TaxID=2912291 RepID=A0A9E7SBC0_9CAUD|nr:HNH homing endonuclease [Escherichia phage HC13]
MATVKSLKQRLMVSGDCWLFTGCVNNKGYGQIRHNGKTMLAHRVAYELITGEEPNGVLLHTCDTPLCCNPEHLTVGTQRDNLQDMRNKGRGVNPPHVPGEKCGMSKLTNTKVKEIRSSSLTQRQLATIYGVSQPTIGKILRRETWRHVI